MVACLGQAEKALRYLCHKDNPAKFQYKPDLIYGTVSEKAIAQCSKGDALSEKQSVDEIISLLDEVEGFVSYSFFLKLINERGLFSVFRRMGILAVRLLDEHNSKEKARIDYELARIKDTDNFKEFLHRIDYLPFEERCELLSKYFPAKSLNE